MDWWKGLGLPMAQAQMGQLVPEKDMFRSKEEIENILNKCTVMPNIHWHVQNISQVVRRLLERSDNRRVPLLEKIDSTPLPVVLVDALLTTYTMEFLNSFDRAQRVAAKASIRGKALSIASACKWAAKQANFSAPEDAALLIALHDFALGLAYVCTLVKGEPESGMYKQLEG
jgi:hypothetical protein